MLKFFVSVLSTPLPPSAKQGALHLLTRNRQCLITMEDPGLLSAFVDNLVARLFSLVEEKYKLYKGFEGDVAFLMRELPMITSAIDGQLLGHDDHILRLSVEELRQVAHEMEDCIDHIVYDASWEQQRPWFPWCCKMDNPGKKRKSRSQLGEAMLQLRCRLEEALQRQQRYTVNCASTSQRTQLSLNQPILQDDLVGIDAPLKELLEQLAETEGQPNQMKVISIVGFCGLGKTTLARELYNSEVGKQFQERAWVSGAHGDPRELLIEILQQLHKPEVVTSNVDQLSANLWNYLNNKRYFIVIDDMRSDQWSMIKSAFPRNASSTIVVTTKIQSVANTCSSTNGYIYQMRRLDEKHSRQLFLKNACPGEYSDYWQPESDAILKKCDGQPLALATIGHFMRKKSWPTGCDCEDVCNQVRFYHLQSGDDTLDRMHQVLIHDYASLPNHALKACFLYFAMFPSDHPVRVKRIKRQWLAEGFVQPTKVCSDLAAENLEKLMDQNIIQPINVSNNTKVKTCKTYGMMHEYITLKSLCENFITLFDGGEPQSKNIRRLCLHHNSITDGTSLNVDLSLVRSLIVFGEAGKATLNFNKYQLLRVLDLEDCTDLQNDHLKEVCNLLLLKYLSLGGNLITSLPKEIKQLTLLETLDLRRTNVKILPTEVVQLPHLIHLFGKFKLPDKATQELQKFLATGKCKLQTLAGFLVDESEGFVELMGYMKILRKVKIWCESSASSTKLTTFQKAIQDFIHDEKDASNDPRSLSLQFDGCSEDFLKGLKAPCYLRSLKLQGRLLELPGFVTELRRLRELCLQSTKMTAGLLTALTNLKHLQYLKLIADELDEITIKNRALPRLLCLCFVLKRPTFPNIEEGALPFLESLQLLCKDLDGISNIQIKCYKRLREVTLDGGVTNSTITNLIRAAKEHPNRPKVILLKAPDPSPTESVPREDSAATVASENGTGIQMLHTGPNSALNDFSMDSINSIA